MLVADQVVVRLVQVMDHILALVQELLVKVMLAVYIMLLDQITVLAVEVEKALLGQMAHLV